MESAYDIKEDMKENERIIDLIYDEKRRQASIDMKTRGVADYNIHVVSSDLRFLKIYTSLYPTCRSIWYNHMENSAEERKINSQLYAQVKPHFTIVALY